MKWARSLKRITLHATTAQIVISLALSTLSHPFSSKKSHYWTWAVEKTSAALKRPLKLARFLLHVDCRWPNGFCSFASNFAEILFSFFLLGHALQPGLHLREHPRQLLPG